MDDRLSRATTDVLRAFPEVVAAWVFGSEARGDARPDSDLDVGLLLADRKKTAADSYLLLGRLAATLERVVPGRMVDLVLLASQGPIFQHRVLSEGQLVLDADPAARIDFESDAYVRYFDFLPTYDVARRYAVAGLRDWFEKRS